MPPNKLPSETNLDLLYCFRCNPSIMYFELTTSDLIHVKRVNSEAVKVLKEFLTPVVREMWERRYSLWERVICVNSFMKATLDSELTLKPADSITRKIRWNRCCEEWPQCVHNPVVTGCTIKEKKYGALTVLQFDKHEKHPDDGLGYIEGVREGKVYKSVRITQDHVKHEPRLWICLLIQWIPPKGSIARIQTRKISFQLSNTGFMFTQRGRDWSQWADPDVFVRTTWEDFESLLDKFINNPWRFDALGPDYLPDDPPAS
jgi:hypothetical protein